MSTSTFTSTFRPHDDDDDELCGERSESEPESGSESDGERLIRLASGYGRSGLSVPVYRLSPRGHPHSHSRVTRRSVSAMK